MTRRLNDVTPEEWDAASKPRTCTALELKAISESFDYLSKQFSPLNSLKPEYVHLHTVDGTGSVAISRQMFMEFEKLNYKGFSEAWDDKNEDRIDVIGQNGGDGLHYGSCAVLGPAMDNVSKPKHYKLIDCEAIDMIADALSKEEFHGYCLGNVMKYRLRAGKKGDALEDLAKADEYEKIYERYYGENND